MIKSFFFVILLLALGAAKQDAGPTEYPWTVSLQLQFLGHDCAGAILNEVKSFVKSDRTYFWLQKLTKKCQAFVLKCQRQYLVKS